MDASCSLPRTIQVRIEPIGSMALLLRKPGESSPSQAVRESHGPFQGILSEDGIWMFITHPREGIGLVGLPVFGETGSWECAFGDERIELSFRLSDAEEWQQLIDWGDLPKAKNP